LGSYTRSRSSENGIVAASGEENELYSAGFDAAWEIDLFGGIKRNIESAQALLEASVDNYYGVQIALEGEVASTYVELRTIQLRIQYAQENIRIQESTLELTRNLFDTGQVSELDVKRAESTLANSESQIPTLKSSEIQTINRLAVLLGDFPGTLGEELTANTGTIPQVSELPAVGLPADLLRRRPDIRKAERQLASQVAKVGVATAEKYPSFSLSGAFNLQASDFSNMGTLASRTTSYGPSLKWNIFNDNRIISTIKMQEALAEQARIQYEQTVLTGDERDEKTFK
jgi:multidrug efflux system outer membrane protein